MVFPWVGWATDRPAARTWRCAPAHHGSLGGRDPRCQPTRSPRERCHHSHRRNGPLLRRDGVSQADGGGGQHATDNEIIASCRCGACAHQPFRHGTHSSPFARRSERVQLTHRRVVLDHLTSRAQAHPREMGFPAAIPPKRHHITVGLLRAPSSHALRCMCTVLIPVCRALARQPCAGTVHHDIQETHGKKTDDAGPAP